MLDIEQILSRTSFITGCTNQLLFQREDWFDLAVDILTLEVKETKMKVKFTKEDKLFMTELTEKNKLSNAWLEDKFNDYTLDFLLNCSTNQNTKPNGIRNFTEFQNSTMYKSFVGSGKSRKLLQKYHTKKCKDAATPLRNGRNKASNIRSRKLSLSIKKSNQSVSKLTVPGLELTNTTSDERKRAETLFSPLRTPVKTLKPPTTAKRSVSAIISGTDPSFDKDILKIDTPLITINDGDKMCTPPNRNLRGSISDSGKSLKVYIPPLPCKDIQTLIEKNEEQLNKTYLSSPSSQSDLISAEDELSCPSEEE